MDNLHENKLDSGKGAGSPPDYLLDNTVVELFADSTPHQRAALGLMAISHCYDLPLAPMLSRLGGEASGTFARQTMFLASEVYRGEDPLTAIQDLDHVMTPSSVLALQVARENGSLSDLYQSVLRRPPQPDSGVDESKDIDARFSRLMIRGAFVMFLVSVVVLRVLSEFGKMLEEFDLEPPVAMGLVLRGLYLSGKLWFLWVLMLILLGIWVAPRYLRRWNPDSWRKRVFPKSALRRQTLAIVAQDSDAAQTGIVRIASSSPVRRFFPKLDKASTRTDAEQASWESLAAQGVITKQEASTLASSQSGETQAWLLRWSANTLGDRERSKENRRMIYLIWIGNILLALVVFLISVSIFSTLLSIMAGLPK